MVDAIDLRRLAGRCYSASRNCYDLAAATEFRKLGDELTAKATQPEHAAQELCVAINCQNRQPVSIALSA
jgi:hypothetical protein